MYMKNIDNLEGVSAHNDSFCYYIIIFLKYLWARSEGVGRCLLRWRRSLSQGPTKLTKKIEEKKMI